MHHLNKNESFHLIINAAGYPAQQRIVSNQELHHGQPLQISMKPEEPIIMGIRGFTYHRKLSDDATTEKDSLGHIPYTPH